MLITPEPLVNSDQNSKLKKFQHCPVTDMQNDDEALPSIILAGQGFLSENAHNS